jgi:hypothetical protein
MPSLHAAAAWVFLHFARKSLKYLLVPYVPFFCGIIIEAVASKWHYLIDLPVGWLWPARASDWPRNWKTAESVVIHQAHAS